MCALEPSIELYDIASKNQKNIKFALEHIATSALHTPLSNNSVDFVVSTWTLCSIPCPDVALKEVFRVLKTGGKLSFVEHGMSPSSFIFKIQNLLTPVSKQIAGGCNLNRDIESLIQSAGFEVLKLEKFPQRLKPLGHLYKGVAVVKR